MKFSVNREKLCEAVSNLSRAVSSKVAVPVLAGILISASDDKITLYSYNLEIGMTKCIPAKCEESGDIVIDAKYLSGILRTMDGETVNITVDERNMCRIECSNTVFDIMGMAAVDFPEMPSVSEGKCFEIDGEVIKNMVRQTVFAVASEEGTRPVLTGINFIIEKGNLKLVAIDGYRLAIRQEKININEDQNFIVSGKAINEAVKIINEKESNIIIRLGKRHINFEINGYILTSRLLDGEFIDYKKAIPTESTQSAVINTRKIIEIIERMTLIINDSFTTPIRCAVNKDSLVFSCSTAVGRAVDKCEIELEGDEFEIGINSRYILDALRATECDEVKVIFKGSLSAIVIKPLEGEDFLYMMMPMRLK